MGCVCFKNTNSETDATKKPKYSWENRSNGNPQDYCVENCHDQEIIKLPGSVNGEQLLMQNCENTNVFVFDNIGTVTVDDCRHCTIILGAVKSSVFLRNCVDVVCITSCGQFRSRDCVKCHVFISSATQPIIETSAGMKFSALSLSYSAMQVHREACVLTNSHFWTDIFDFTPTQRGMNFSIISLENVQFKLKCKRMFSEKILKELNVTWLGKALINSACESIV